MWQYVGCFLDPLIVPPALPDFKLQGSAIPEILAETLAKGSSLILTLYME